MTITMTSYSSDGKCGTWDAPFSTEEAEKVRTFHKTLDGYAKTPLRNLAKTAKILGLKGLYVKDESYRFGLNAFKGLGGSYALAKVLAEKTGKAMDDLTSIARGTFTFVTATDGNHGRGVAWAAQHLGQKAVIYMPKGSRRERLENIRKLGAEAEITSVNYDDTVRLASRMAEEKGWILVQDTAWEGYEDIPRWIMQGYGTMGLEAYEQLPEKPTHIFLQAGVGSLAGAITGLFSSLYGDEKPIIGIVEPDQADCLFRTAKADDGKLHPVTGHMRTIMAGLACGEPCSIGWQVLSDYADFFISCPDYAAAQGMRILGNPMGKDQKVVSGESGAAAFGAVSEILRNPELKELKEALNLNENSRILFFSTEGDTDKENYRRIVWDGLYAK